MSFKLVYSCNVSYVGDGGGPIGFLPDGPTLQLTGVQTVPGGAAPSGANFTTACTSMGTDISTQINVAAVLARIQAFATGGQ